MVLITWQVITKKQSFNIYQLTASQLTKNNVFLIVFLSNIFFKLLKIGAESGNYWKLICNPDYFVTLNSASEMNSSSSFFSIY